MNEILKRIELAARLAGYQSENDEIYSAFMTFANELLKLAFDETKQEAADHQPKDEQ